MFRGKFIVGGGRWGGVGWGKWGREYYWDFKLRADGVQYEILALHRISLLLIRAWIGKDHWPVCVSVGS